MLAPAAAGSVLELSERCSSWSVFVFSFLGKFLLLPLLLLLSGCHLLPDGRFCSDPDGPDEAQQFTSHCGDDLPLVLACRPQLHIALVQPVLRLPGNLFDLFRNALLSFAQRRTRYLAEDDSSMPLRQRFVADVRCRSW